MTNTSLGLLFLAITTLAACKSSPRDRCFGQGITVQTPADCEATCADKKLDDQTRAEGCWMLGGIYAKGPEAHRDAAKARASYRASCNLGNRNACSEAGMPFTPR